MLVMIDRGDYWQCAFVIPKGSADHVRQRGLLEFRSTIRDLAPWVGERVDELKTWDDIKLLTVAVDRSQGGTGLASSASAMRLTPCRPSAVSVSTLPSRTRSPRPIFWPCPSAPMPWLRIISAPSRTRREWPTRVTQAIQIFVQNRVIARALGSTQKPTPPLAPNSSIGCRGCAASPARLLGLGIRPEHVRTPEAVP
jgi:hypothetical protein